MDSEIIIWALGIAALIVAFRAGQSFEREEAPRRRKQQEEDAAREGALINLAVIAAGRGESSTDFQDCLVALESLYPGTKYQWSLLSNDRRIELAAEGIKALQDPEIQAQRDRSHQKMKALETEVLEDLKNWK